MKELCKYTDHMAVNFANEGYFLNSAKYTAHEIQALYVLVKVRKGMLYVN